MGLALLRPPRSFQQWSKPRSECHLLPIYGQSTRAGDVIASENCESVGGEQERYWRDRRNHGGETGVESRGMICVRM